MCVCVCVCVGLCTGVHGGVFGGMMGALGFSMRFTNLLVSWSWSVGKLEGGGCEEEGGLFDDGKRQGGRRKCAIF